MPDPADVETSLQADPALHDVILVHCETTSGVLNPLEEIAAVVSAENRRLIVDAMSSFGAIPIDMSRIPIDGLAASSNKCLQGVPGVGKLLEPAPSKSGRRGGAAAGGDSDDDDDSDVEG